MREGGRKRNRWRKEEREWEERREIWMGLKERERKIDWANGVKGYIKVLSVFFEPDSEWTQMTKFLLFPW